MVNWDAVRYVSISVVLASTILTSVYVWMIAPIYGRRRWTAAIWAAYGIGFAALGFWSVHVAVFSVGMLAPLLSHNAFQLWTVRVLGVEDHRKQLARVLTEGGRAGCLGAAAVGLALRSTIGLVLVMATERGDPVAWLGYGVVTSTLPAFAAALRLAFWPPSALRGERKAGDAQA